MSGEAQSGLLQGIRVIELAGLGPAPFACTVLADLGADVIRVDRPGRGELDVPAERELLNRGKRSIVTGRGQVVDASILDGTLHLLTMFHGMLAAGQWSDARGVNTLDGGAPFCSVYETADGRFMAVGALESKFYRAFLAGLDLDEEPERQYERGAWPGLRARIAARFASRTQQEWTRQFAGTDAGVAPVLSLGEAAGHPQVAARRAMVDIDGVVQPAPAPRFSRHPRPSPGRPAVPGADTRAILAEAGLNADLLLAGHVVAEASR
jgi:alpha-methylacyl-CoA racemase